MAGNSIQDLGVQAARLLLLSDDLKQVISAGADQENEFLSVAEAGQAVSSQPLRRAAANYSGPLNQAMLASMNMRQNGRRLLGILSQPLI